MVSELTEALRVGGPTGLVIILLAAIAFTLLTSLITLVKWVLQNMVPNTVHESCQSEVCERLDEIKSDTGILVDRGVR